MCVCMSRSHCVHFSVVPSYHIAVELLAVHMFVCVAHTEDYIVELPRLALGQVFLCILRHAKSDPEAERGRGDVNLSPMGVLTLRPRVGGFYVSGRLWEVQSVCFYVSGTFNAVFFTCLEGSGRLN